LDAYRAAGLDEDKLLVVSFGFEGKAAKDLLEQNGPYKASVAMFPELVGRICIDAAMCVFHGHPLPDHLFTPFVIITSETLERFYQRDIETGEWLINWHSAVQLLKQNPTLAMLEQCRQQPHPKNIGYVQIFSSHEWYQNMQLAMQSHTRELGISLEVLDASQDMDQEINALKRAIGYKAARFVNDGDTIILDAGITTTFLASALKGRQNITVITNSLSVLAELEKEKGISLVSCGGVVRSESRSLTGPGAEATFRELRADKAFISTSGLSLEFGLSNTNIDEATIKRTIIQAAREVIVLADQTKIGGEALVKIVPIEYIHRLITDTGISTHDRLSFVEAGIDVIVAEENLEEHRMRT
jgi:DeoR/GlpR family transcriptional regulator of sugar metabolism